MWVGIPLFLLYSTTTLSIESAGIRRSGEEQRSLSESVSSLSAELKVLKSKQRQQDKQLSTLLQENRELKTRNVQRSSETQDNITAAFTVAMVHGHYHLRDGSLVPFGIETTNIGNHYKPDLNSFLCPVTGVYFFSISLHSGPLSNDNFATTVAEIVVVEATVATAFCATTMSGGDAYLQCSQSVVVRCERSSRVWVKSRGNRAQLAGDSEGLSTFTGFLIKQL